MTALHAVGGGLPLALHMPHVVEQAGSLAGFAAVIGLAVLSALYFSQARDLRRLREWAGRAPERAAEMAAPPAPVPGRVVATPQRPPQAAAAPPAQTKPAPAAANGDAAPSVAAGGEKAAEADSKPAAAEQKPAEAPAKPGMPAPASAAAAASAGAAAASAGAASASLAGPKAPDAAGAAGTKAPDAPGGTGAKTPAPPAPSAPAAPESPAGAAPKPTPQRPPGSVLPPRTGTLPPVRRLPSSNVGASQQTSILGPAPQQQQRKRNPLYVALAVIGVLVIGAAAAVGVPAIVNGSKNSPKKTATTHKKVHRKKAVVPADVTVAVLNGTSINGLAGQIGDRVEADGFNKGTVSNASLTSGQRANSVVMYVPGHQADARLVAKRLSISNVEPADSGSRQIAGDATVIVLVGTDKSQGAG